MATTSSARARRQIGELITLPAGAVHVRQDGPADGKPVLLLHGLEGSVHWWDGVAPLLADTHRVIRVDLLGFGCTGGDSGLDPDSQSAMLASLLDTLDVSDVAAVGHSYGADSALGVARQSSRVSEVVIVNQAPDYTYIRMPAVVRLLALTPLVRPMHERAPRPAVRRALARGFARGFDPDSTVPGAHQFFLDHHAMTWRAYREVAIDRPRTLATRPLDAQLRELALPALIIHGRHDSLYDADRTCARYAAAGAHTEVIDAAGHSPNVETPEAVATLLRTFLANPRPATA